MFPMASTIFKFVKTKVFKKHKEKPIFINYSSVFIRNTNVFYPSLYLPVMLVLRFLWEFTNPKY